MNSSTTPGSMDRRRLLVLGGKLTFGTAVALAVSRGPWRRALAEILFPDQDAVPLPDACIEALTEEEQIIAAIVDTVVPGTETDPSGAPGALDACALNLVYDEFFPFVEYVPALISMAGGTAGNLYDKDFLDCTLQERTAVLLSMEDVLPFVRLAFRFIRAAFYAGAYNFVGTDLMGWPGPNFGYVDHEEFSFREAVCEELTEDGNLP